MSNLPLETALIGNRNFIELGIGMEIVARAARILLFDRLNDELDRMFERWREADTSLQMMGFDEGVGQVDLPHVPPANLHEGPHRSLIEAPPESFPNVSVMAYMTTRSATQFTDQTNSSDITLFIEAMAITGPVPDGLEVPHETIVHRRIQRMTEAIALVIQGDPSLLGTAHNVQTPPRGGIGNNSWLRPKNKGAGERFLWHGSRLQYTVQRHHAAF